MGKDTHKPNGKFAKGNSASPGRPKGSRNKSNVFSEAIDKALKKTVGSNDGAVDLLQSLVEDLYEKIQNKSLDFEQTVSAIRTLSPYFSAKHMSQKTEKTVNDNTVSTKMQMEMQEMKFKMLELAAENKRLKEGKKPLSIIKNG